jgi:hypothetical protein
MAMAMAMENVVLVLSVAFAAQACGADEQRGMGENL